AQALRDMRNQAASYILSLYLDALPFLIAALAFAVAGLVAREPIGLVVALIAATGIPVARGWVLHDIRNELDDGLPWWVSFLPIPGRPRPTQLVLMYAVLFSVVSRRLASALTLAALVIGAAWTLLAYHRHQRFEAANQHLGLTRLESSALSRARILGLCS